MIIPRPADYQSYLLRLWRVHSDGNEVWRVALEEPLTSEMLHFDDLSSLFSFLCAKTAQDPRTVTHLTTAQTEPSNN